MFTLQAVAQAGLASHLIVPSVTSFRGCPELCEQELVLATQGFGCIRGAPLALVDMLEAAGECRMVARERKHRLTWSALVGRGIGQHPLMVLGNKCPLRPRKRATRACGGPRHVGG